MIDIKMTLNGRPFSPESLEEQLIQHAAEELRERIGSIRHPETGEFPTIAITGSSLDQLQLRVEGSPELLALVESRLAADGDATLTRDDMRTASAHQTSPGTPNVFLSYASEDAALARRVAEALMAKGINTWVDQWCLGAGDSIRQKVDEGIEGCTHFIVLMTPRSAPKRWVRQEMDAGFVRYLADKAKFIALRSELAAGDLPPLLQGLVSPSVSLDTFDITQLINDIHGVTKAPLLGAPPTIVTHAQATATGLSPAASTLAKYFIETTVHAQKFDPMHQLEELSGLLNLPVEDVTDAIYELQGCVTLHHGDLVHTEEELFVRYDKFWKPWNPEADALSLATMMTNDENFPGAPEEIAARLGWEARRLNPALAFLCNRNVVSGLRGLGTGPWLLAAMHKTDATRRFVKSRQ